jgi:hypothetical protein
MIAARVISWSRACNEGEMMIVGQHLGEAHLTHHVHGNTIHEAACFITTAGAKNPIPS